MADVINPPPGTLGNHEHKISGALSDEATLNALREECALLRGRISNLEAEKVELTETVRQWRGWYTKTYRPQIQYLDAEVARLLAQAPQLTSSGKVVDRPIALPQLLQTTSPHGFRMSPPPTFSVSTPTTAGRTMRRARSEVSTAPAAIGRAVSRSR
eukprot:gnl/TRDRNA2_/TRDRNA2_192003_c0_seq1.p1 gnl/TRDRNA2_/TRDRNA2_192003_c0~~gnl/TRDRNA2_/TRDRNA2_192003_c0_seq1.p1  ORF type:complete len:157 (+),score=16.42 gnl/TRDRNA2_/TRDRNA2_192003_c0_seq1:76-546(+)